MVLYYCNQKCQDQIKKFILKDVLDHIINYNLRPGDLEILNNQGLNGFRIEFDPFEVIGDPATLYEMLIPHGMESKLSWINTRIEASLTRPYLILESDDNRLATMNSALDRIGRISSGLKQFGIENQSIALMLQNHLKAIHRGDYRVENLGYGRVDAYAMSISNESYNTWEDIGETGRKSPLLKERLVFHLNVSVKQPKEPALKTFCWERTDVTPDILFHYLVEKSFIKDMAYPSFEFIFSHKPIEKLPGKIIWIDRGKNLLPTVGLIVDFIYLLSCEGLISDEYRSRQLSNSVIEACFALEDGSQPIVQNKKVTSRAGWTEKIKDFSQFLTNIPSIPS